MTGHFAMFHTATAVSPTPMAFGPQSAGIGFVGTL